MNMEITIQVTDSERAQIENLARQRGVGVDELVRNLVMDFVQEEVDIADTDEEDVDIEAEFRQSWRDALAGNVLPLDELWKALDEE